MSIEVIDLRSISPVDYRTVTASVRKTGRVVVTHEAAREAGVGAELIASVTERCFNYLEAAPVRVTGHDIPYPPAKLEKHHLPDLDRILDAVDRVLDRPNISDRGANCDPGLHAPRPRRGPSRGRARAVDGRRGRHRHAQPDDRRGRDGQGRRRAPVALRRHRQDAPRRRRRRRRGRLGADLLRRRGGGCRARRHRRPRRGSPDDGGSSTGRGEGAAESRRLRRGAPRLGAAAATRALRSGRVRRHPTPPCSRRRRTTPSTSREVVGAADRATALHARRCACSPSSWASISRSSRRPAQSGLITRGDVEAYATRVGAGAIHRPTERARPSDTDLASRSARRRPRSARRARRSAACASSPPRRWCAAPSRRRT